MSRTAIRGKSASWFRAALWVSFLLVSAGMSALAWRLGWYHDAADAGKEALAEVTREQGFSVEKILVETPELGPGHKRETKSGDILKAIGVTRGTPILGIDLDATRARIEALPWIRKASVERRLPDTLYVRIHERSPMALWQRDGGYVLVDTFGVAIPGQDLKRFRHLVVITGKNAPEQAPEMMRLLAKAPVLAAKVRAAALVSGRRWDVHLASGIKIRLPETGASAAWLRLAAYHKRNKLLDRDIVSVDLRIPDRFIVKPRKTSAQKTKERPQNVKHPASDKEKKATSEGGSAHEA